jgi:2-C-methyl-D-erythritol 4-phosphate cytidylyltransferase
VEAYAGAVIVAAGKGSRLKAGTRKAKILLAGRPLFAWSQKTLSRCPCIGEICLVSHPRDLSLMRAFARRFPSRVPVRVVPGGAQRQESVAQGVWGLQGNWKVILAHDAARPFASAALVKACAETAMKQGCGVAAVPVKDTIKRQRAGKVESLPRHELWAAQTPQACRASWLKDALAWAGQRKKLFTDEAGLLEAFGKRVCLVEGEFSNLKITTPEDLALAKGLAAKRRA